MDKISKMQYKNLRDGFDLLVETILGKDYYNTEMDVYHCDLRCCSDIIEAYNSKIFKRVQNPFTREKCETIITNSIQEYNDKEVVS